jgi:hypothetical protein
MIRREYFLDLGRIFFRFFNKFVFEECCDLVKRRREIDRRGLNQGVDVSLYKKI